MTDSGALLTALQFGDGLFPGGGSSFSWGLEPLHRDGLVRDPQDVAAVIRSQLYGRWQPFDRSILLVAHDAPEEKGTLDDIVERMTMAAELREGSRRAGAALLAIHSAMEIPGTADYYREVRAGDALGHVPVVQGVAWRGTGLDAITATALSAQSLIGGMLGAALRLNLVGHATAQNMRRMLQADMIAAMEAPPVPIDAVTTFAPLAEIAAMRHPSQPMRLFAT